MDEIKRHHLVELFSNHRLTHAAGSTNRMIILVRYIFNLAIRWEIEAIIKNPADNIPLYPDAKNMERFLTADDAQRLFTALEQSEAPMLKNIVAMLLLTGARKNEVLHARWSDFDFVNRLWAIEFNKTGKPRYVPLSDATVTLLQSLPRIDGCEYPFANPKTQKPFVQIFWAWDVVRKKVGMPDLRIHDLRHSFASFLVNSGRSLYEVQKILGHTQIKTTQRYAHLAQDTLLDAANIASASVPLALVMPKEVTDIAMIAADHK
jgi:integrase